MNGELRLALVGAGPRGTSVVERLLATVDTTVDTTAGSIVLHVIDEFPAGPGAVWRTRQRTGLLMNTVASQVSMFTDESVRCEGPIVPGPCLHEWSTWLRDGELPGVYPAWVRAEADRLGPDDYPSRAFYGHYLQWVFRSMVAGAPDRVSVVVHGSAAVALDDTLDGKQTLTLRDGTILSGLDGVVLALGHGPAEPTAEQDRLTGFAKAHKLIYLEQSNPADTETRRFMPGEAVALRGLGLNFFDYMNLLTVERGGVYEQTPDGLRYRKSGLEPQLYAGSRRGIPYHARGDNQKGASGRHVPVFLTDSKIKELRQLADAGSPVTFADSVWPLVDLEVKSVYYGTLIGLRSSEEDAQAFLTEFAHTRDEEPLLRRHGIIERWSWDWITRPQGAKEFADSGEFTDWLLDYLRADVEQARMGNLTSPLKAALDVLRDLRNEVRLVVDHGGIGGASYRDELESWYSPLNAYTSIGPPARRIEEMIALIEAGVLRMTGPGMTVEPSEEDGCFLVRSSLGAAIPVTGLIEARLPETDLRRSGNPLLRYLLATGQCRPYRMRDGDGFYESGGLSVTARPYRVVDRQGHAHPARFAFGVPTEGVHWVTAAGIRPGVGSVTLEDADAIARACLAVTADAGGALDRAI